MNETWEMVAVVWILSGLAAIWLSRIKKQSLLLSIILGFLLGPLGVLMILWAAPDLNAYSEEEKNKEFYDKLAQKLDRHFLRLIPKEVNIDRSVGLTSDLLQICNYFTVKIETATESQVFSVDEYIEIFKQIYTKFNKEYSAKFAVKYPGIKERIIALDKEAEKYEKANEADVDDGIVTGELGPVFDISLMILAGFVALVGLVGMYYLFFTKLNPPVWFERVIVFFFAFMTGGDTTPLTWLYIKSDLFFSGIRFGLLAFVGMIFLYFMFSVEISIFLDKMKKAKTE